MKTNKIFLSALIILLSCLFVNAQTLKFAHINSAELLQMMPGVKEADLKLQEYVKQLEEQNKTMVSEYQSKMQEYQTKEALMADAIKEIKIKEITDLEMRIQQFQQSAQEKIANKKEELYAPILEKAENAIKELAKEKGYAYVFDTSIGAVLFAQDSDNIMTAIKAKLGIK